VKIIINRVLWVLVLCVSTLTHAERHFKEPWTVDDLLISQVKPFAIGHRGYGENPGSNPDIPIENTIESVQRAFKEGVSIVEVDVVITADNHAVAIHDDFIGDFPFNLTCINSLTYDQLRETFHHVPTLKKVLRVAKKFAHKSTHISGLVNIEVKTPSPICDPGDTSESALVNAVIDAVNKTKMHDQVIVEVVSPALMNLFLTQAPSIKRNYSANALQFLSPMQIFELTGMSVVLIDKNAGYGLDWAEVGPDLPPFIPVFRLPGYYDLTAELPRIDSFIQVALATMSQIITFDKQILMQMEMTNPGSAFQLVQLLHSYQLTVFVYTVDDPLEWNLFSTMNVDGIYTNNISLN